jgi:hypothetical protein
MSFEMAVRTSEIMLALAFIQQGVEHLVAARDERLLFGLRLVLCVLLLTGFQTGWVLAGLFVIAIVALKRFDGPYNGGSDRMGLLLLVCLLLARILPNSDMRELAFGYLAAQLVLSYVISGWVKIVNPAWRSGEALREVFRFSVYPVSQSLRGWADWPQTMLVMSWAVMLFELVFPLALLSPVTLWTGLVIAGSFHLANACLFGLNRFFWVWLSAYPALIWLEGRLPL